MNPLIRRLLVLGALLLKGVLFALVLTVSRGEHSQLSVKDLLVEIADSSRMKFVSVEDVREYLRDSVIYLGRTADSIDLTRIEDILDHRSAIRKSEAWITSDGALHLRITQREPVVRFQKDGTGFYADSEGFLFPLSDYSAKVPVVDGAIPLHTEAGFKGEPGSEAERLWLRRMLDLANYISDSRIWSESIAQITVQPDGDLILVPRTGRERFLFGPPQQIREKFDKMRDYYEYIAPSKEEGYYRTVNVKYKGQIVCRK